MLLQVGANLSEFGWANTSVLRCPSHTDKDLMDPSNRQLCSVLLDGASLIDLLRTCCRKLDLVHVKGMIPLLGQEKDYAWAFRVLRRRFPEAALYLETDLPTFFEGDWFDYE